MKADYLIIGQGLAGSLMAYDLIGRGKKVIVFDQPSMNQSSSVAAGLYNPITGRRFSKTWIADKLFPFLLEYYSQVEKKLGNKFLYKVPMFRPFQTTQEQNEVHARNTLEDLGLYIQGIHEMKSDLIIRNPEGGVYLKSTGFLDIPAFMLSIQEYIRLNGQIRLQFFNEKNLKLGHNTVHYEDISARRIIFCNGIMAATSRLFDWLPFRRVKGELIYTRIEPALDFIYNRNIFILPVEWKLCKVGATYDWENIDAHPTKRGKKELECKLKAVLNVNFKTIDHKAGIRPATKDRRPFLGVHPEFKNVYLFNGLGSKGVSLGPYFSKKFGDYLEHEIEFESEANIKRYISLY